MFDIELPYSSVAVQVTIVSPSGNTSGASLVTVVIPDISSAVNSPRFSILVSMLSASIVKFSGAMRTGDVVSTTVMV